MLFDEPNELILSCFWSRFACFNTEEENSIITSITEGLTSRNLRKRFLKRIKPGLVFRSSLLVIFLHNKSIAECEHDCQVASIKAFDCLKSRNHITLLLGCWSTFALKAIITRLIGKPSAFSFAYFVYFSIHN